MLFKLIYIIGLMLSIFVMVISISSASILWLLLALTSGFFFIAEAFLGPFKGSHPLIPTRKRW